MVALGLIAVAAASVAFNVGVILQAADARREPAAEGLRLSLLIHRRGRGRRRDRNHRRHRPARLG